MKHLTLTLLLVASLFADLTLTPDGNWVSGQPTLTPDGNYVGSSNGEVQLTPDGDFVGVYDTPSSNDGYNNSNNYNDVITQPTQPTLPTFH